MLKDINWKTVAATVAILIIMAKIGYTPQAVAARIPG